MNKKLTLLIATGALGVAVAGCGSSRAPGIVLAPSGGATTASATSTTTAATTTTATTTTTTASLTSTVKLPAALSTQPKVTVPKGAPPKKLVVKDLIKGTGPAITSANQTIEVKYVGVNYKTGKVFDASWTDGSGAPVTEALSVFIPGWKQGLIGMKVGGRRELIIPPSLAYGDQKTVVPANSTLIFIVDLHAVS